MNFADVILYLPWTLWDVSLPSNATSHPMANSLPRGVALSVAILYLMQGQAVGHARGMHSLPWGN